MISPLLYLTTSVIIGILLRIAVIYGHKRWFQHGIIGDAAVHWTIIKQLNKNPKAKYIDQYIMTTEPLCYPLAFHRYCQIFPLKKIKQWLFLPNFILFSLSSIGYLLYLWHLQTNLLPHTHHVFLLTASTIFFLSVSNLIFIGPQIAYLGLSERLLARISASIFILTTFVSIYWLDTPSMIIASISGAVALMTAQFARQTLFFITPLLAIFSLSWVPLTLLTISIIAATLISRHHFINGVKNTARRWKIYATHTKKSTTVQQSLSHFIDWRALKSLSTLKQNILKEPSRTLLLLPELILFLILFTQTPIEWQWLTPIAAAGIIYLLTTTKYLNHLGESYRYLEYGLYYYLPLSIAHSLQFLPQNKQMLYISIYMAYVITLTTLYFLKQAAKPTTKQIDPLSNFLTPLKLTKKDAVFPVTMRLGADICARTECKSFWWQPGTVSKHFYDEFIEAYPYLKTNWQPLCKKYNVTHIIADKKALKDFTGHYDFSTLKKIAEDDHYIAYSVAQPT